MRGIHARVAKHKSLKRADSRRARKRQRKSGTVVPEYHGPQLLGTVNFNEWMRAMEDLIVKETNAVRSREEYELCFSDVILVREHGRAIHVQMNCIPLLATFHFT